MIALLSVAHAQIDRAGMNGTVKDAKGGRVAGATIVATETATGLTRETVTSRSGTYDLPEMPIGSYTLTFSATGFEKTIVTGVEETVGRTRTLDVVLRVQGMSQTVNVYDTPDQLDETSASLGARIEREQVYAPH